MILLISRLCKAHKVSGWRQAWYNIQRLKNHWRNAQKSHRSRQVDAEEKKKKAYKAYLRVANHSFEKTLISVQQLQEEAGNKLSPKAFSMLQNDL